MQECVLYLGLMAWLGKNPMLWEFDELLRSRLKSLGDFFPQSYYNLAAFLPYYDSNSICLVLSG